MLSCLLKFHFFCQILLTTCLKQLKIKYLLKKVNIAGKYNECVQIISNLKCDLLLMINSN